MEWFDNFWSIYSNLVMSLGTNGLLALSIYLTLACGMLAMANAAFMGIGAYTASLLTMNAGLPFPVALAGGMVLPAVVAVLGRPIFSPSVLAARPVSAMSGTCREMRLPVRVSSPVRPACARSIGMGFRYMH